MKKERIQSDLAKARGLGSAHEGVRHWMDQKITAIAAVPLVIWLVYSIVGLKNAPYEEFTAWLAQPLNAILMILFIMSVFYHACLGAQVITEDYISTKWFKMTKLIGQRLYFTAIGVACVFCILKVAFTG